MEEIKFEDMVSALKKPGMDITLGLTANKVDLLHMAVGISGEAGELLDAVKKHVIYNKELDFDNVVEELGDLEFYLEGLRQNLSIIRKHTLDVNIKKLATGEKARYKLGKYSDEQAQARQDKS